MINRHELRARRREAGLTQTQLAERAGLSKQLVCDLEAGRRQGQHAPTVKAIADGLGVEIWAITTDDRTQTTQT